jgi:hypothetical protein
VRRDLALSPGKSGKYQPGRSLPLGGRHRIARGVV